MSDISTVVFNEVNLKALLHTPDGPVGQDLARRCTRVQRAAKLALSQPGRGRVYTLTKPKRTHQASAPGDPPAVDLGHLRASVDFSLGRDANGDLYGIVGTNLRKGLFLELGTSRMTARPWLRVALRAAGDGVR